MTDTGWILLGAAAVLIMCLIAVAFVVAAKLPPIRLHDLRHGAASLMLAAGSTSGTSREPGNPSSGVRLPVRRVSELALAS